jgi:hypothetical protein
LDLGFKEAKLAHPAIQQETMMIANAAFQGQLELWDLAPQLTQGEVCQPLWTVLATQ